MHSRHVDNKAKFADGLDALVTAKNRYNKQQFEIIDEITLKGTA